MVEGAERRLFAKGGARELQFADTPILKFRNPRTEAIVRMNAPGGYENEAMASLQKPVQAQVALDCHSRIFSLDGPSANSSGG
jgi:hypothetical protein